jgi:predicted protein tyrosine phosphatase
VKPYKLEIVTMSRAEAVQHEPRPTDAVISIYSPSNPSTPPQFFGPAPMKLGYSKMRWLCFHDLPKEWTMRAPQMVYLDGMQIAEFVVDCVHAGVDRLIVHCDYGLSRSVSIADAIHRVLRATARREDPPPNLPVYLLTLEALVDKVAHLRRLVEGHFYG